MWYVYSTEAKPSQQGQKCDGGIANNGKLNGAPCRSQLIYGISILHCKQFALRGDPANTRTHSFYRKSPSVAVFSLPWICIVLVLLILIYYLLFWLDDEKVLTVCDLVVLQWLYFPLLLKNHLSKPLNSWLLANRPIRTIASTQTALA